MERQIILVQYFWHDLAILRSYRLDFRLVCLQTPNARVMVVANLSSRNAVIGEDKQCRIGLKLPANVPLLVFDLIINVRGLPLLNLLLPVVRY